MNDLLAKLLKNERVAAGLGAVICALIAAGAYQPSADVGAALTTFVAIAAGGAVGAVVARIASKFGPPPPPAVPA